MKWKQQRIQRLLNRQERIRELPEQKVCQRGFTQTQKPHGIQANLCKVMRHRQEEEGGHLLEVLQLPLTPLGLAGGPPFPRDAHLLPPVQLLAARRRHDELILLLVPAPGTQSPLRVFKTLRASDKTREKQENALMCRTAGESGSEQQRWLVRK
jgi:hypothetical protein